MSGIGGFSESIICLSEHVRSAVMLMVGRRRRRHPSIESSSLCSFFFSFFFFVPAVDVAQQLFVRPGLLCCLLLLLLLRRLSFFSGFPFLSFRSSPCASRTANRRFPNTERIGSRPLLLLWATEEEEEDDGKSRGGGLNKRETDDRFLFKVRIVVVNGDVMDGN